MKKKAAAPVNIDAISLPKGYGFRKQGSVYMAVVYVNGVDVTQGYRPLRSGSDDVPDMSEDPQDLLHTILEHQKDRQEQARIDARLAVQGNLL